VNLLDKYFEDGHLNATELKALGNWGLQKYKSGEISGKKSHIEAILNFLLVGGEEVGYELLVVYNLCNNNFCSI